jgi:uncharacterized protein
MSTEVRECLIIFTRYPEPGKVKTRLIPALGAVGAATLHQRMTEHTLQQARALRQTRSLSIEVWFTGGSVLQMQEWLGTDVEVQPQPTGNLGDRMAEAFKSAFCKGYSSAVLIGTDCPDLNTAVMEESFSALKHEEVVIGPALDGGYYLIGMRYINRKLFVGISWSTQVVLQQTLSIAKHLNLGVVLLSSLNDIDTPEDIEHPFIATI